jgi:hypothetical protein
LYKQQVAKLKSKLAEFDARRSIADKAKLEFLKSGKFTVEGYNEANQVAADQYSKVDLPQKEKELIDKYNQNVSMKQGGFSGGKLGRSDDFQRFYDEYKAIFRKDPAVDETTGNPIPQFSGAPAQLGTPQKAPTTQSDSTGVSTADQRIGTLKQKFGANFDAAVSAAMTQNPGKSKEQIIELMYSKYK